MATNGHRWFVFALGALREWTRRSVALLGVMLALNALTVPYAGLTHDARLYSLQVTNYLSDGAYADDLFFQYGSQDRYSLFSRATAPLVRLLGVPGAFFSLYLVFNFVFLAGLMRLVRALLPHQRLAGTCALILVACTYIPFGGFSVNHVNENFLTPRIMANALVLLGLAQMLRGRLAAALCVLLAALAVHPLMAFPGFLVFVAWYASTTLSRRQFCIGLGGVCLLALGVVAIYPVGSRVLGVMDETWMENVRRANPYTFPLEWSGEDWLRLGIAFAVVLAGARSLGRAPGVQRFLCITVGVAALGLLVGIVACFLPYALLMQGQAHRAVWLVQLLQYPLAALLIFRWRPVPSAAAPSAAMLLGAYYLGFPVNDLTIRPLLCLCIAFPVLALVLRPWSSRNQSLSGLKILSVAGLLIWFYALLVRSLGMIHFWPRLVQGIEMIDLVRLLPLSFYPVAGLVGCLVLMRLLGRDASRGRLAACVCGALLIQTTFFLVPMTAWYQNRFPLGRADVQFVADTLRQLHPSAKHPTVYWPNGRIDALWFELQVNSYFEWPQQIAGNVFSVETAAEGARRAALVKPFELQHIRTMPWPHSERSLRTLRELFQSDFDVSEPNLEDLTALSSDPRLDFIVVPQRFDGLYVAGNGTYYLYDCRRLRQAAALSSSPAALAIGE